MTNKKDKLILIIDKSIIKGANDTLIELMGKYLSILYRQEQKYINKAMQSFELGFSSCNFLIHISKNEGANQRYICNILAIDEALATRTVKKLEKKGLIFRKKEKQDQRSYTLYLTQQGKEMIPVLKKLLFDWWSDLTQELDNQESSFLLKQLEQMSEKAIQINKTIESK